MQSTPVQVHVALVKSYRVANLDVVSEMGLARYDGCHHTSVDVTEVGLTQLHGIEHITGISIMGDYKLVSCKSLKRASVSSVARLQRGRTSGSSPVTGVYFPSRDC